METFDHVRAVTDPVTSGLDDLEQPADVLVLGIGNLLWADEGFGIRALETLHAGWSLPPGARLLDGGTQGLYLLPYVERSRRLLIFDAVDYGLAPGTLKIVRDADVPAFMGAKKLSLHQTGFQEVLAVAALRGWQPQAVALVGVQPELLDDYGGSLSGTVRGVMPAAVDAALALLRAWGCEPAPRAGDFGTGAPELTLPSLSLQAYEHGRPGADVACRVGDARFLPQGGA